MCCWLGVISPRPCQRSLQHSPNSLADFMGGTGKPKWNLWKGRGGKRNKGEGKKAKKGDD